MAKSPPTGRAGDRERDSAKTAPHCKGFVRVPANGAQLSGKQGKSAPIRFGCSINAWRGFFDRLFNGDGFASGLMVLCRLWRLGIRRPRPRDQSRENSIPEAYDYLDHRADPLPACCAAVMSLHQGESSAGPTENQSFGRCVASVSRSGMSRLTLYGCRNESGV